MIEPQLHGHNHLRGDGRARAWRCEPNNILDRLSHNHSGLPDAVHISCTRRIDISSVHHPVYAVNLRRPFKLASGAGPTIARTVVHLNGKNKILSANIANLNISMPGWMHYGL